MDEETLMSPTSVSPTVESMRMVARDHEISEDVACLELESARERELRAERREKEQEPLSCCANCLVSSALAMMLCKKRCDAGAVIAEFAFFPPSPPTYWLSEGDGMDCSAIEYNYEELSSDARFAKFSVTDGSEGRASCRVLTTSRKEQVPSFFFSFGGAQLCLIYLHANATDCGGMLPTYARLSKHLGVSVLAVEFCGYGAASGRCGVANCHADARAASEESTRRGYPPSQQVLYGQSVGSGPACHLAARLEVAGLILHSPIASGIRALASGGCCSPVNVYSCLDPFNNLREIKKVKCPVFILHGTDDEEIPWSHGKMLQQAAARSHEPFWVEGAGHNNVAEFAEDEYFARLNVFLSSLLENSEDSGRRS